MPKKVRNPIIARCAECESRIYFNIEPDIGTIVTCKECGEKMEVIELNPIELDWAYDDYDDQDYDYDDEFEEYDY